MPARAFSSSVLPLPRSPASPRISPRRRKNETFPKIPHLESPSTRRISSPGSGASSCRPQESPASSPMMSSEREAWSREFLSLTATAFPSRRTVSLSQMSSSSSIWWDIYTIAFPRERMSSTIFLRIRASLPLRGAEDSSRTTMGASSTTQDLSMSRSCLSLRERSPAIRSALMPVL